MTQRTKAIRPRYRARSSGLRGPRDRKGAYCRPIIEERAATSARARTFLPLKTGPKASARAESIAPKPDRIFVLGDVPRGKPDLPFQKTASETPTSTTMSVQESSVDHQRALASHVGPHFLPERELCLLERHQGVVVRVEGGEVVVRYNSGDECFELSYAEDQFQDGALPKRGDQIEACVVLWREPGKPRALSDYLSESEIAELREDASTGVRGRVEL